MKTKIISIVLLTFLISIIVPNVIFAAFENVAELDYYGTKYQLFDDGTAKAIDIKSDVLNGYTQIGQYVQYNGEDYELTSISSNALDGITVKQDLHIWADNAPELENKDYETFFANINNIYIYPGAQGYTKTNGWPEEKVKVYKIDTEPQDIIVTAGDIKDTDKLETTASILAGGGSIVYNWYYCDENGKITDENPVGQEHILPIPKDLSYNNSEGTAKDYYFICAVGCEGEPLTYSRVAKVTVNPGTYKVIFLLDVNDTSKTSVKSLNSERKINLNDIPSVSDIVKLGKTFTGWLDEDGKIVDLETTAFTKNTTLYPRWETKIKLNANGRKFTNGRTEIEITFINSDTDFMLFDMLSEEDMYDLIDITDDKTNGKSMLYDYEEFLEEKTFYLQWEESEDTEENQGDLDKEETGKEESELDKDGIENPQTHDGITSSILLASISLVGIASVIYTKRRLRK